MSLHNKLFKFYQGFPFSSFLNAHLNASERVPVQVPYYFAFERDLFAFELQFHQEE